MAQRKPEEKTSLDQVLKLADQLTPEEQEQLVEEMKLQWLRRELGKAEDELRRGEGVPAEQVFAELRERNKAFREKGGTV
jgi:DNA relaxase NicK